MSLVIIAQQTFCIILAKEKYDPHTTVQDSISSLLLLGPGQLVDIKFLCICIVSEYYSTRCILLCYNCSCNQLGRNSISFGSDPTY